MAENTEDEVWVPSIRTENHDWTRFHRDSRYAFGDNQRFQAGKPNRDWLRGLGLFLVAAAIVTAWIVFRIGR